MRISSLKIKTFIQNITKPQFPGLFNPWSQCSEDDLYADAHLQRQTRFFQHLSAPNPRLILIGEAAGYQGCRYSGIPFTSERLVLEGAIPRVDAKGIERISSRTRPWSEPSATIVWKILAELELSDATVLFNAVPWHPEGIKGPGSNRTPSQAEKGEGRPYLKQFLELFPNIPVAALGNVSSQTLSALEVTHHKVRHPAYGGATQFREGLSQLVHASSI